MSEWPVLKALPSYGRGRDAAAGRYTSLIFGTNLTDVIVTGMHASNNIINPVVKVGEPFHQTSATHQNFEF